MKQSKICELKYTEFPELMELFLSVFREDSYYAKLFHNDAKRQALMKEKFSTTLQFCLKQGTAYGMYEQGLLVAFLIAFDYPYIRQMYPNEFLEIFAMDDEKNIQELPYYQTLHESINLLGENVTYLLSLGVKEKFRRKGYASKLLDQLIQDHAVDYIVSDVSNTSSLQMYKNRGFKCITLEEGYTFVKAIPKTKIQELDLTNTTIALPISFGNLESVLGYFKEIKSTIPIHGYNTYERHQVSYFKKEASKIVEANVYDVSFLELLHIQKYINVIQYHEEYLRDNKGNFFLLYSLIQEYKSPVLYNDTLNTMLDTKSEEWNIMYDMQVMIPMKYENKDIFIKNSITFDEDFRSFHRYLDFRMHYEAGVFNGHDAIDERAGFKKRIERFCLEKIRIKIMEEVSADTYDVHGDNIGQPAYVNVMVSIDKAGEAALVSLVSLSSPFLISHFMDNIVRNQLYVEDRDGNWVNLYEYLVKEYQLYKRGTPKFFVNILQDRACVCKEQIASMLLAETIYQKNEALGCVCDEDILQLIDKKNGMGQYDRAYVYAHTNVCIQFSNHLRTSIKGRLSEEAITYFYMELLGFEEAVIQIANQSISSFLTEKHDKSVSAYLDHTYQIYSDYAHTIEFWDIQMNYPSSRKSLSMLRDAFKIEEQLAYMDRNLQQLQRIFETQRDIVDRKENSLLNYIILFLTLLQGIAIVFPMLFDEEELWSTSRLLGVGIITILLCIYIFKKYAMQRLKKRVKS